MQIVVQIIFYKTVHLLLLIYGQTRTLKLDHNHTGITLTINEKSDYSERWDANLQHKKNEKRGVF